MSRIASYTLVNKLRLNVVLGDHCKLSDEFHIVSLFINIIPAFYDAAVQFSCIKHAMPS